MRGLIVCFVLLGSTLAVAQPGDTQPPPRKTLRRAAALSWGATVVPMATAMLVIGDDDKSARSTAGGMIATGAMLLGPSAGHCYAGRCLTPGLGLRLAGAGVIAAMVVRERDERLELGTVIVGSLAAVSLWTTGLIWDAVTLPRAVRRSNRERSLLVAPIVRHDGGGIALTGVL
jgi:hypothetical protein